MKARNISERVVSVGAVDWDRRLFDALIPLPDGTSYNAFLVRGKEKTALIDAVDPAFTETLLSNLAGLERLDYLVANHAEQDHAGAITAVLARFPETVVLCTPKCKDFLADELHLSPERVRTVADAETLSLGDRTLEFLHMPWVHWPETMTTWMPEERTLFSCDFFGSHLAANELLMTDEGRALEAAKRYYAEIMMPFRPPIRGHLDRLSRFDVRLILPSHGPGWPKPSVILDAYRDWVSDKVKNTVVLPYVSMHGSTKVMVDALIDSLTLRGIAVERFDLSSVDLGRLAMALVDAATIVLATPAVLVGPHPHAVHAAYLANALRPKTRFAAVMGSFGWGNKVEETLAGLMKNLKVELLPSVMVKGLPRSADLKKIDELAEAVAQRHRSAGILSGEPHVIQEA
ncbi:MAG: FprA family A-type flavoprotein [Elusimicrobia bacterium]|nr:FprA family A-type flavoprotein [Elusimicrobiota bacterium]